MEQRLLLPKAHKLIKALAWLVLVLTLTFFTHQLAAQDVCKPVGWATQNGGVTGGGNATPVVVSTHAALKDAITNKNVKVVHVKGVITFPNNGRITMQDQSGKTIFGLPGSKLVSVDMSSGGSGILYVKRVDNLIIQNMHFEGPGAYDNDGNDNLTVDDSRNVWVDHSEFHDGMDGNFDIKNKADFISVTWCTFSYEKPPRSGGSGGSSDHRYTNLIGSSDGATGDEGKLRITFQYCWWGEGCKERMPRIRYGKVDLVNNYYSSSVANQGIRAGFKADVRVEGNYFISGYSKPIDEFKKDYTAILSQNNTGTSNMTKGNVFTRPYSLAIANANDIVTPIKSCAGAKLTSVNGCSSCGGAVTPGNQPPLVSIISPTNNQQFKTAPATISINANASDADGSVSKVEFYNGSVKLGEDNSSPYSYTWSNVAAGNYSITAKATDNKGAVTTSSIIKITVETAVIVVEATLTKHGVGSATQSITAGEPIAMFYYSWTNASTVSVVGVPTGIQVDIDDVAKTVMFSGVPTQSGTFDFTLTTVGSFTNTSKSGTFSVTGDIKLDCEGIINGSAYLDNCGVCVGGKSVFKPCVGEVQGEAACTVDGVLLESTNSGFFGQGYVNTDNRLGAAVSWVINSSTAQNATLTFRYANGGAEARSGVVSINGKLLGEATFNTTEAWTTWKLFSINLDLVAGENELIIKALGAEGLANIDVVYFSEGVSEASCIITGANHNIENSINLYPNPTQNVVTWSKSAAWSLHSSLGETIGKGDGTQVDLSTQATGVYFLKIDSQVIKVIKQ